MNSDACSSVSSPGGRLSPKGRGNQSDSHQCANIILSPSPPRSAWVPLACSDVSSPANSACIEFSVADALGRGSHATPITAFSEEPALVPSLPDVEIDVAAQQTTGSLFPQSGSSPGSSRHESESRASSADRTSLSDPTPTLNITGSVMPDVGVVSQHQTPFNVFRAFHMLSNRPNPQVSLDAVHMSQAFTVTDTWQPDQKTIFVSEAFLALTGYERYELLGLNCRMLQSPQGVVKAGSPRRFIASSSAYFLKEKLRTGGEFQHIITNYKKSGEAFANLLTIIPIPWDTPEIRFIFGFATDLTSSPNPISYGTDPVTMNQIADNLNLPQRQLETPGLQAPPPAPKVDRGDVDMDGVNVEHGEVDINCNEADVDYGGVGVDCGDVDMGCGEDVAVPSLPSCDVADNQSPTGSTGEDDDVEMTPEGITSEQLALLALGRERKEDGPGTNSWNRMLLENIDGLVQIISPKGTIVYISQSCRLLGYMPADLVGRSIERICHPFDRVSVMRTLQSPPGEGLIDMLLRLQAKGGGFSWYHNTGSAWSEGSRRWAVLVGYRQPAINLSRDAIGHYGGVVERDTWFKVSTSGLILHAFPNPQIALGTPLAALVGSSFHDLIPNRLAHPAFRQLLANGQHNRSTTSNFTLLSSRGRPLQVTITVHPSVHTSSNGAERPYFLLLQCRISQPPRSLKRGLLSFKGLPITQHHPQPSGAADDNVFQGLEADKCGVLQYEVRRLISANQTLESEIQDLVKRSRKRKKLQAMGADFQGCANCRTWDSPEWRRGPSGKQDLCNSCGLRYLKSVRTAQARRPSATGQQKARQNRHRP